MNNLHIEEANKNDLDLLNSISVNSKRHWNYPEEWIQRWLPDLTLTEQSLTDMKVVKLMLDNEIIGFCALIDHDTEFEVEHLWVVPDHIGKGYGKFLLNETLHHYVPKLLSIKVIADPNAERFYASQGFVTYDEVESYPKGRMLPVMRKDKQLEMV